MQLKFLQKLALLVCLAAFAVSTPVAPREPTFDGFGERDLHQEDRYSFPRDVPGIYQAYQPVIRAWEVDPMELDGSKRPTFYPREASMAQPLAIRNIRGFREPRTNVIMRRAIKTAEEKRAADSILYKARGENLSARSPPASPPNSPAPTSRPNSPAPAAPPAMPSLCFTPDYSGPGGYSSKAVLWAYKKKNTYRTLPSLWKDPSYDDQFKKTTAAAKEFNDRASQAMAQLASGVVYVMLPSDTTGTDWVKGTVWNDFEWPNLGSLVTKVIRINPDNDKEEVIKGH